MFVFSNVVKFFFWIFFLRKKKRKKREMRSKLTLFEGVFFHRKMGSLKKRFLTTKISTLLDEVKKKREKGGK